MVARQGSYCGESGGWADVKDDWQAKGDTQKNLK